MSVNDIKASLTYCESSFFKKWMTRLQKGVLYLEINQQFAQVLIKQKSFLLTGRNQRTLTEKIASSNTGLIIEALREAMEPDVEIPMHELAGFAVSDEIVVSLLHKLPTDIKKTILTTLRGNKKPCVCEFADATRTYYASHEGRLLVPFDEYLEITGYGPVPAPPQGMKQKVMKLMTKLDGDPFGALGDPSVWGY